VDAVFKATRIVTGHSVMTMAKGELDFRISHRFGQLNTGAYELWGLDNADMRISLEYGITDDLEIGLGRSSYNKVFDGFAKYVIKHQEAGGDSPFPLNIAWLSALEINTHKGFPDDFPTDKRMSYTHQLLIARKFNSDFSLQIMPTVVHRNVVSSADDLNTFYAMGIGTRYKISKRVSVNAEYFHRLETSDAEIAPNFQDYFNAFGIGFDIETGGHVFQLHITNSRAMTEKGLITETAGDIGDGGIYFGFNISRTFNL
jgi:opacity protein-like surface antigen